VDKAMLQSAPSTTARRLSQLSDDAQVAVFAQAATHFEHDDGAPPGGAWPLQASTATVTTRRRLTPPFTTGIFGARPTAPPSSCHVRWGSPSHVGGSGRGHDYAVLKSQAFRVASAAIDPRKVPWFPMPRTRALPRRQVVRQLPRIRRRE
jgi:hypothetical protein